jgi:hypothetical protein
MLFILLFLILRLAKEEDILPLFLICFGYSAPSVLSLDCEWGTKEYLFNAVAMWNSSALDSE